ncbi:MAG: Sec-independent protein translocase protein TatB [Thermoanaerobaculum sp.]|nr:Sec-independent protein translocase protein TatB [Thermoanaerobaculum sp.]
MFGSIGVPELVMIFIIALLLFGPKQLPHLGRTLGRALAEFKRASNDLQRTLEEEVRAEELRAVGQEVREATHLPHVLAVEEQDKQDRGARNSFPTHDDRDSGAAEKAGGSRA